MTTLNEINQLKLLAKRYAHARRLSRVEALDAIAEHMAFPHWKALALKAKQGWVPSPENLAAAEGLVREFYPTLDENEMFIERRMSRPVDEPIREGKIGDHDYQVFEVSGDIRMEGEGWRVLVGEADSSQPVVEIETTHSENSPAKEQDFLDAALAIAIEEAVKVRAGIASDWPRRSTKPDAEGAVVHPLHGDRAAEWFCLHCDGKITGAQIAENLWHCPGCGASPIDIFSSPWWLGGDDKETKPVEVSKDGVRPEVKIKVVDSRPTLRLDEQSTILLLRAALLEDAATPSERIGALLADINVDEENYAWITLDEDLWSGFKEPKEAMAVAKSLGLALELEATWMSSPFAWPDLGHVTTRTSEYVKMLLDAYAEHGVIHRKSEGG